MEQYKDIQGNIGKDEKQIKRNLIQVEVCAFLQVPEVAEELIELKDEANNVVYVKNLR